MAYAIYLSKIQPVKDRVIPRFFSHQTFAYLLTWVNLFKVIGELCPNNIKNTDICGKKNLHSSYNLDGGSQILWCILILMHFRVSMCMYDLLCEYITEYINVSCLFNSNSKYITIDYMMIWFLPKRVIAVH